MQKIYKPVDGVNLAIDTNRTLALVGKVAVMYLGRIVEQRPVAAVLENPHHPYTQALLPAVPTIEPSGREVIRLEGELPSPTNPPSGCHFHPRCTRAKDAWLIL